MYVDLKCNSNPQTGPDEEGMKAIHTKWKSTVPGAGPNKLAMAAALTDEADVRPTDSGAQTPVAQKDAPPTLPVEQRIILLQALLAIGAMPEAMFLLGKYPWVAQSHPAVADLLLRNMEYSLDPVYKANWPMPAVDGETIEWAAPAPHVKGNKAVLQTTCWPIPPDTPNHTYQFFYPDWASHLSTWSTYEDLYQNAFPWMQLVRGLGARNPTLMVKLCRLGVAHFRPLRKAKMDAHGLDRLALSKNRRLVEVSYLPDRANPSQPKRKCPNGSASSASFSSPPCPSRYTLPPLTWNYGHSFNSSRTRRVMPCTENGATSLATRRSRSPVSMPPLLRSALSTRSSRS